MVKKYANYLYNAKIILFSSKKTDNRQQKEPWFFRTLLCIYILFQLSSVKSFFFGSLRSHSLCSSSGTASASAFLLNFYVNRSYYKKCNGNESKYTAHKFEVYWIFFFNISFFWLFRRKRIFNGLNFAFCNFP